MSFDGVIASEVIEHVPDPEGFCSALAGLSRRPEAGEEPQGLVIISTLNRTPRSYALAVLAAERLLGMLPVGTHDWDKFITPGTSQSVEHSVELFRSESTDKVVQLTVSHLLHQVLSHGIHAIRLDSFGQAVI